MADVFISYARSTAEEAQLIAAALKADGYSVWIDDQLPAHREFPTVIEENLLAAKAVLVLWSRDARTSRWVPAEADLAHSSGKLVQLSLDGASPPLPFNRMQCEAAPGWRGDLAAPAWRKILASIAELVGHEPASSAHADAALVAEPRPSTPVLAVLAFDNLSTDPELTFFCDGVSDEIQRTVARASDLRVLARSSSFQFRGADKTVAKVAAALGATHVLDGTVRRNSERVRITAELVDCASRSTLWNERFDGDLRDVFDLQENIAAAVARALEATLSPAAPTPTLDPLVYESFLRARSLAVEGSPQFDDSAVDASVSLEEVVAAAPDFAPAWELLAESRAWMLRTQRWPGSFAEGRDAVLEAAHTALKLDPSRGGALGALAMLEPWGAYATREKLLRQALEVAPGDPATLTEMSTFCWSVGRFREALRLAEHACELNPLMPSARLQVAMMRAYAGDYGVSIYMLQELHRRWPSNAGILLTLVNNAATLGFWEAYDAAVGDIEQFDARKARDLRAARTYAETLRSNDPAKRADRLRHYEEVLDATGTLALNLVEALSQMGMSDEALALAERASFAHIFNPEGAPPSGYFPGVIMGRWSVLNRTPRFIDLCDRLGLCDYWAQSPGLWPDCADWAPYDFKAEVRRRVAARQRA